MEESDLQALLSAAQSRIRGVCVLLAKPRHCHPRECVALFREAQGYLEWFRDSVRVAAAPPARGLRRQATELAEEIRHAAILLERTALYGGRWLERIRATAPEYTAAGGHALQQIRGHISYLG